jgi:hypothetical protein
MTAMQDLGDESTDWYVVPLAAPEEYKDGFALLHEAIGWAEDHIDGDYVVIRRTQTVVFQRSDPDNRR